MLALPIATGAAGFFPSLALLAAVWAFMASTGLLLAEVYTKTGSRGNLVTISGLTYGRWGRVVSWLVTLFLFYCLLTAYFVGMATQISCSFDAYLKLAFSSEGIMVVVSALTAMALLFGDRVVDWSNRLLMLGLVVSYVILITLGLSSVHPEQLMHVDWSPTPFMLPIVMLSYGFQIVVPTVVDYAQGHRRALITMILVGSMVPLVIYGAWQMVVLGNIPLEGPHGIYDSCARGLLATHSMRELCCQPAIVQVGEAFVLFAIVTSLLAVAMGFRDFLADGLRLRSVGWRRLLLVALVLGPSMFFAVQGPTMFLKALSLGGGFGVAILFGVLPPLIAWKVRYGMKMPGEVLLPGGRPILLLLVLVSIAIICIQGVSLWRC